MFALRSSHRLLKSNGHNRYVAMAVSRSMSTVPKIIYTETDEAPALATYSLLPIVRTFAARAGIVVEKVDISLCARILAQFPKYLTEAQKQPDTLVQLGELCKQPDANIIK